MSLPETLMAGICAGQKTLPFRRKLPRIERRHLREALLLGEKLEPGARVRLFHEHLRVQRFEKVLRERVPYYECARSRPVKSPILLPAPGTRSPARRPYFCVSLATQ